MHSEVRLNKFLSDAGVCSRREADRLAESGRVTVDGRPAEPGQKVRKDQRILVDGRPVESQEKKVILAVNKPVGVVCTASQKDRAPNIVEMVRYPSRVYPVGRLDKDSEGLILMTNDGALMNGLLRAAGGHEKEYLVEIDRPVTEGFIKGMAAGVPVLGQITRPCIVRRAGKNRFRIILTQGLNRQIRRMCEYFDCRVVRLRRERIVNIRLEGLSQGSWRELTPQEESELRRILAQAGSKTGKKEDRKVHGAETGANKGTDRAFKPGRQGVLSGKPRDHAQCGVRPPLR